jgi:hypothetical protein
MPQKHYQSLEAMLTSYGFCKSNSLIADNIILSYKVGSWYIFQYDHSNPDEYIIIEETLRKIPTEIPPEQLLLNDLETK